MRTIDSIQLTDNEREALKVIQRRVKKLFRVDSIVVFGSVVRGEKDKESDIDLLILTSEKIERLVSHQITDIVFEINLHYDTNYSVVVLDKKTWDGDVYSILPIKKDIQREGVLL